jgi:tetratricopeptide (TPR) repeat protein
MLKFAANAFFHVMHPPTRALNFTQAALNQNDLVAATKKIAEAKRLFPERSDVNEMYARIYAKHQDWEKVQLAIEQIATDSSAKFAHVVAAAKLFRQLGNEEKAIELFRRMGQGSLGWKAGATWNPIGSIYLRNGEHANALNAFAMGVCREGPALWTLIIEALQGCAVDSVAECRERMGRRVPRKTRAYPYYKMLSLLEQKLYEGGRIGDAPMLQSIRTATEISLTRFHPKIQTDGEELPLKPSFLIIGAMKCGTTTLFDLIAQHPRCLTPFEKELQFFQYPHLDNQWYLEHFPRINPDRGYVTGDASPGYYTFDVVGRVRELLPNVKLIFIQRDPAERAVSHVRHNSQVGMETFGPEQAIARIDELEQEIAAAPENAEKIILDITYQKRKHNSFLALGCYELLLRRWKSAFGPDQLLTLDLDALSQNPQATMTEVFQFIGLEPIKVEPIKSNQGRYDNSDPQTQAAVKRLEHFYRRVTELTEGF